MNNNTRIKLIYHLPALDTAFVLQKKVWWGWKTLSWTYPKTHAEERDPCKKVKEYLEWSATYREPSNKSIGEDILRKCKKYF